MESDKKIPRDLILNVLSPCSGFPFISSADRIIPEEIAVDLNTAIIGRNLLCIYEIASTQDVAEKLAREGAAEGTAVIAEKQVRGRGRRGRSWISPSGEGIYISLILKPVLKPDEVHLVTMAVSVALVKSIEDVTGIRAKIKWPNDIMIGSLKAAGILTEMHCEADRVNYIILGIGINVNTGIHNLPESIKGTATSLKEESGSIISRTTLIRSLLKELDDIYKEFNINGFPTILHQWKQLNATIGSKVEVFDDKWAIYGTAVDVDEDGFLLVKTDSGEIKKIISGDVSLRCR